MNADPFRKRHGPTELERKVAPEAVLDALQRDEQGDPA